MNSNSKSHKSSSIFIAAVLVAGLIAIATPSITFAEDDYKEYNEYDSYDQPYQEYNEYDSYDQPYKQDMRKSYESKHDGSKYDSFKCNANNFNINKFSSKTIGSGSALTSAQQLAESSELTPAQVLDSLFGGGLSLHVKNVCINFGDNDDRSFVGVDRGQ